jgi:hypothetical protein
MYSQTYTNAAGCDSIENLFVSINQSYDTTIVHTDCDFFSFNGVLYTTSGIYTDTVLAVSGCDSIVHLDLTIHSSTDSSISSMGCNSLTLNGLTYTNTGTFTQTLTNAYGCDSVLMLQVTIDTLTALITMSGTGISTPSIGAFQWIDCNTNTIIPGATNLNFVPALGGSYAVIVTTATCVDTSICLTVWATGTNDLLNEVTSFVYPNPNQGIFEVSVPNDADVTLLNFTGEIILQTSLSKGKHAMDISKLAKGVYFLKININGKVETVKMLKE